MKSIKAGFYIYTVLIITAGVLLLSKPVDATFRRHHKWTPSVTPTVTPTPTEEVKKECDGDCISPTPPVFVDPCEGKSDCGRSREPEKSPEYKPTECTKGLPAKTSFTYERKDPTTVVIRWNSDGTNITHWGVSYGKTKDSLVYGIPTIAGEARSVEIGGLWDGVIWIQLHGYNSGDCRVDSEVLDP